MDKSFLIFGIAVLTLTVGLSGCFEDNEVSEIDRFIGTWETEQGLTLIFYSDGTCSMAGLFDGSGTWELDNGSILITLLLQGGKNYMSYNYHFSDNYTTLTLTDAGDREWIYIKQ
jgi:hypothetical protein